MSGQNAFQPGTAVANLSVEVELTISARKLRDLDSTSKSDPMCVLFTQPFGQGWIEYGRTEVLQNCLDPDFSTRIRLQYRFEEQQKLKLKLFDVDSTKPSLDDHDFLGEVDCTLAQIVSAQTYRANLHLKNNPAGEITVSAEEIGTCKEEVELHFAALNLKKNGIFSKPDPFIEIYRHGSGSRTLLYRSTYIPDTQNPTWPPFHLPLRLLKSATGEDFELTIQCFNYNRSGDHTFIGEVHIPATELFNAPKSFSLKNPKKSTSKETGELKLRESHVRRTYSFLDYIMGGTQISCTFAIDFTGSNGHPTNPSSLHFLGPNPNWYECALRAVGDVVEEYDTDKQFPVLGFGACLPIDGKVSHEFFVNMTQDNPYCSRVQGVLQAYRSCLSQVQLAGPTNFAPVINHAARFASAYQNGEYYFILLILTDGAICDMQQTIQAIVQASTLPLSIIIVGIGNADFSSMDELDSDNKALSSNGITAARDIVQFVPFNQFLQKYGNDQAVASYHLATALLAEVPNQLVSYMKSKNFVPRTASGPNPSS